MPTTIDVPVVSHPDPFEADHIRMKLHQLASDLAVTIDALTEIWGDLTGDPERRAREALQRISVRVQCPYCGGSKTVLCSRCKGGGTREHPCPVCRTSGEETCSECLGLGEI